MRTTLALKGLIIISSIKFTVKLSGHLLIRYANLDGGSIKTKTNECVWGGRQGCLPVCTR